MRVGIDSYGRYKAWREELSSSVAHETVALLVCHSLRAVVFFGLSDLYNPGNGGAPICVIFWSYESISRHNVRRSSRLQQS